MKKYVLLTVLLTMVLGFSVAISSCTEKSKKATIDVKNDNKLLVFTKTEGFRHASIPDGVSAINQLAADNGWVAHHTEDASVFTSDSLSTYQAIIFLNTTGDILNGSQQSSFETYIQLGGGFVGIHAAADTEYEWPWYGRMVGAYFKSHPKIQEARLKVVDQNHSSTTSLPDEWIRTDEWYNFKDISPDINVLIILDESSYEGGENGNDHPAAWYHIYDGGRIFYTAGGHTSESYASEPFLNHLWGGIEYVTNTAGK